MLQIIFFTLTTIESLAMFIYMVTFKSIDGVLFSLSLERLFISIFFLAFLFLNAYLLFLSIRNFDRRDSNLKKITGKEETLWISFGICFALIILSYLLIIKGIDLDNQFDALSLRMNPILVFFICISAQAGLFLAVVYCLTFVNQREQKTLIEIDNQAAALVALFLLMVIFKLVFVTSHSFGPVGSMDEMSYFYYSESFYMGNTYDAFDFRYPPLYPISIIPGFSFNGFAYDGILLINSLLMSAIVFPIFFISRQILDHKKSLLIALISCLISFNLVFPARIASENLYFPLLFWALLVVVVNPINHRFRIYWDIVLAALLSAMYLTRFITLAAIPFFIIAWWLKPFNGDSDPLSLDRRKIIHLLVMAFSSAIVFSPWLLLGFDNNIPLKHLFGFIITSKTTPEQLTISNLFKYVVLYGSYLVLMASPVLNLILGMKLKKPSKNLDSFFTQWTLSIFLIIAGFFIAVVRHSWRALYNANLPTKLMGRYFIYFTPVLIILALIHLEKFNRSDNKRFSTFFLRYQILPFVMVSFSYIVLFTQLIIKTGNNLLKPFGSTDAFLVEIFGGSFLIIIFLIYLLINLALWFERKNLANMIAAGGLIAINLISAPAYLSVLNEQRTYPYLSYEISQLMHAPERGEFNERAANIILASDFPGEIQREIHNGLRVRGIFSKIYTLDSFSRKNDQLDGKDFLIKYPYQIVDLDYRASKVYEYNDEEFEILEIN
jgi:hypothetical protein